jgi:hypothetical protein
MIKIWDVSTGTLKTTLRGHSSGIYTMAFSPDGTRLLSGSKDDTIKLWDVKMGVQVLSIPMRSMPERPVLRGGMVSQVVFSPDGKTIAADKGDSIFLYESEKSLDRCQHRIEGETARRLVDDLYQELGYYSRVIEHLKMKDASEDVVHRLALQIANSRLRGDGIKLHEESLKIVRVPGKDEKSYKTALGQMEKARDLVPSNPSVLNTLGVAQYRVNAYKDALKTLREANQIWADAHQEPQPSNAAFTAMALHHLGRIQEAQESLDTFRDQMKGKKFHPDKELLTETEKLLKPPSD